MSRIAVFAATRADVYPLAPVLEALAATADLEVCLVAAESLRHPDFADPLAATLPAGVPVEWVGVGLGSVDAASMTAAGARLSVDMDRYLAASAPEAVVVLGDRWELLFVVPPVVIRGIPVVHLHGGEVTEGAVDDRVRHAVTKLADLHCVSTPQAAARLGLLAEPADRVYVTGAPSLDRARQVRPAADDDLARLLGRRVARPLALVTYHPVTAAGPDPHDAARLVLDAVGSACATAVVTHPGLDLGRDAVLRAVEAARAAGAADFVVVPTLGADYLPVLAASDVVVGNSSSGVLEAGSFGVAVVDVGDRQRGRERGANVLHAEEDPAALTSAIRRALSEEFRAVAAEAVNPYGDGHAAERIVEVVRRAVRGGLARKPFPCPAPSGRPADRAAQ